MVKGDTESAPFVDQIVEKTLEALVEQEGFDEATITRLRELAHAGRLQIFESVVNALVGGEEA